MKGSDYSLDGLPYQGSELIVLSCDSVYENLIDDLWEAYRRGESYQEDFWSIEGDLDRIEEDLLDRLLDSASSTPLVALIESLGLYEDRKVKEAVQIWSEIEFESLDELERIHSLEYSP